MAIYKESLEIDKPSHFQVNKWILKNLSDISVIFGRNGIGKSILLRGILNQDNENRFYTSPERAGNVSFDPGIMQTELNSSQRASRRQKNQAPTYRQEVISRLQAFLAKRGAVRKDTIPLSPNELEDAIHNLIPQFKFKITGENPPFNLIWQENGSDIKLDALSSGETEIFTVALDILTISAIWELEEREERILLLDEPDLHLHPELQQNLSKFLVWITDKFSMQIIIATHSTTLLSSLGFYGEDKTSIIYLDDYKEEQKAKKFDKVLQELSICLGGHALMGPLFSYPLLLVEGDDDFIVWSHACRHGKLKFSVIPCNGDEIKKYTNTLEKIFSSTIENPEKPLIFQLRDGDKSVSKNNDFVRSLTLNCHEIENLYLTDEILSTVGELTWEEVKEKIKENASNYGDKKDRLENLLDEDKKSADLKGLMGELVSIIDDKLVDWKIRIANYLGKNIPQGEIKDFLGEDVISTLYD